MSKIFKPKIVSANDLFDGDVVYLDGDGNWTRQIAKAAMASEAGSAETLLARADQPAKVVGPYLLDVTLDDDGIQPDHFRERFRETGPPLDPKFTHRDHVSSIEDKASTQGNL
jgi:hypothetical protein